MFNVANTVLTQIWGKTKKWRCQKSSQTCLCPIRFKCQNWVLALHLLTSVLLFSACICRFHSKPPSYLPPTVLGDWSAYMCVAASELLTFPNAAFLNNRCLYDKWLTTHTHYCTHKHTHTPDISTKKPWSMWKQYKTERWSTETPKCMRRFILYFVLPGCWHNAEDISGHMKRKKQKKSHYATA